MIHSIQPVEGPERAPSAGGAGSKVAASSPSGPSFGAVLERALDSLDALAQESDRLAEAFAAGEDVEVHQVMLAMQETQIAFELAVQVRNRIVDAYQEIMRMQV
ncbi:MAG: flagellar hook-basal body complex protein FliE [Anaerolineae bacterium]|nr:flagellar hook-basal body complex protein FliE [Anaerolineae bacterium]